MFKRMKEIKELTNKELKELLYSKRNLKKSFEKKLSDCMIEYEALKAEQEKISEQLFSNAIDSDQYRQDAEYLEEEIEEIEAEQNYRIDNQIFETNYEELEAAGQIVLEI